MRVRCKAKGLSESSRSIKITFETYLCNKETIREWFTEVKNEIAPVLTKGVVGAYG